MGYVYFLKHKGLSPIKIGMTGGDNLNKRIYSYSTASPYGIEIIGFIETKTPKKLESKIHKLLKDDRLNGEWFDIDIIQAEHLIKMHSPKIDLKKRLSLELPFDCSGYYLNELKMFKCFFDNLLFDKPIIKKSKLVSLLKKNTDIDSWEITEENAYNTFIEYYMALDDRQIIEYGRTY